MLHIKKETANIYIWEYEIGNTVNIANTSAFSNS